MAGPLSEGVASPATIVIVNRFNLARPLQKDPAAVIRQLHARALDDHRRDILFALSELSYLEGERCERSGDAGERNDAPDYFLLAAVYAYYAVLDPTLLPAPSLFDRRIQTACELYNFALYSRRQQRDKTGAESASCRSAGWRSALIPDTSPWDVRHSRNSSGIPLRRPRSQRLTDRRSRHPLIAVRGPPKIICFNQPSRPRFCASTALADRPGPSGPLELHSAYGLQIIVKNQEVPLKGHQHNDRLPARREEICLRVDAFSADCRMSPAALFRFNPTIRASVIFVPRHLSGPRRVEMMPLSGDPVLAKISVLVLLL
jgi:hypothetical protein